MASSLLGAPRELEGGPSELGGVHGSKVGEELGQFAVNEYNAKEGKNLRFKKVISGKQKVVQGVMYYLDIEASEGLIFHAHKIYEVEVWQKPGNESRSLEKFELKGDENVSKLLERKFTPVSVDDASVVESAEHSVEKLNADKNFAVNYEIVQIISANAKLIRVAADNIPVSCLGKLALFCGHAGVEKEVYEIEVKVARGEVQETLKSEVHRSLDGTWTVKHVALVKTGWTFAF